MAGQTSYTVRDPMFLLEALDITVGKVTGPNVLVSCPHAPDKHGSGQDSDPSCSVNLDEQVYNCKACGSKGTFLQLCAQKFLGRTDKPAILGLYRVYKDHIEAFSAKTLDPSKIEEWHRALRADEQARAVLQERKGLTPATMDRFVLGWNSGRYTIPMQNQHGDYVQCKRYSMDPDVTSNNKFRKAPGFPADVIYPIQVLQEHDLVILTEGEIKALLLNQLAVPAVSGTKGAKGWDEGWNALFIDKIVYVLYDSDTAGRAGAIDVCRSLWKYAKEVHHLELPFKNPTLTDVDDWFLRDGHTVDELHRLMNESVPWEPSKRWKESLTPDIECRPLGRVSELYDASLRHTHVEVRATITGREDSPFLVPRRWRVHCDQDQACCKSCPVYIENEPVHEFPRYHPELMRFVGIREDILQLRLKQATQIPRMCGAHQIEVVQPVNLLAIEIESDRDLTNRADETGDNEVASAYLSLHDDFNVSRLKAGLTYRLRGFPSADPSNQRAVFFAYDYTAAESILSGFTPDDDDELELKTFQPEEWTESAVTEKLHSVATDLAHNVTGIYEQPDLHIAVDLVYHSVRTMQLQDSVLRGWIDAIVLGDTSTGKTRTAERLRAHYGFGAKAVGSALSVPGLLGAMLNNARKQWIIRWGLLPLNDGKLVILEECGLIHEEAFTGLREARSSGIVTIDKAKKATSDARTRLLWLGNPRGDRPIDEYSYGIEALKFLIPSDPDIRRFDFALIVSGADMSADVIARMSMSLEKVSQAATSERCRLLIAWAWTRTAADVKFEKTAVQAIFDGSTTLSKRYSSRMPLVNKDAYEKIARIAAAMAARTYSTEDGTTLLVRDCHVAAAMTFLQRIYDSDAADYRGMSIRAFKAEHIEDEEKIEQYMLGKKSPSNCVAIAHCETVVEFLLETPVVTTQQFATCANLQRTEAEKYMGELMRARCIRPYPRVHDGYIKTPGFTALLRQLLKSAAMTNQSVEEMYNDEEF